MDECIRDRIGQIEFLPTFPHIVGEVMNIIDDPRSSASDLVKHMDPSLVSEVLKVANSAYFGRGNFRRIGTVERAVAAIGYSGLANIVLQMPFLSMVKGEDTLFDRNSFIRHSLACGTLGRTVSSILGVGDPNTVYISGILHDIGIVIIYQYFREEWLAICRLMNEEELSRLDAEMAVFSTDHADIGAVLLEVWDIPEKIVASVRLHHHPEEAAAGGEPYMTWLANALAREIDFASDLVDFQAFFKKERDRLEAEIPDRYLMKRDVALFEGAYNDLRGFIGYMEQSTWARDD